MSALSYFCQEMKDHNPFTTAPETLGGLYAESKQSAFTTAFRDSQNELGARLSALMIDPTKSNHEKAT